jgi:pyruvate/2-oxoglutarate dehydrogenase complex dihydrolipoamide acyltransferase (E2) component
VAKVELKMPSYGMADTESVVTAWLREPGELVQQGDQLVEMETDKTEVTLESPATGTLGPRLFEVDAEVKTGAVLTWVEEAGE